MNNPRLPPKLRADCNACCGLCCVVFPFDASQGFGFDKAAHTPCALLRADDRCSIHHELHSRGFFGCAIYDCYGAGQWVTRHFKGATWRRSSEVATQMFAAFRRVRVLHELMAMLSLAITRANEEAVTAELQDELERIETLRDAGPESLDDATIAHIRRNVLALIHATQPRFEYN